MTATTAMPDAVLTGFALNLHALLISACMRSIETATATQQCCCSDDKIARFGRLGYVQVQHF